LLGVYTTNHSTFKLLPRRHPPNPKGLHKEIKLLSNFTSIRGPDPAACCLGEDAGAQQHHTYCTTHKKSQMYLTIESERLQIAVIYRELLYILY